MKKIFYLLWLLAAPILMGSCDDENEKTFTPYSALTSTSVYSKYTNNGYLPKDKSASEMRVYAGDTLRYNFRFETNKGIKDFKIYDNLRGRDFPLVVNTKNFSTVDGVSMAEYELQYIVNNDVVKAQEGGEVKLTVEPVEADGTLYKDPETRKVAEIKFTLATPLVYQNVRLYHYWGKSSNSLVIVDYKVDSHPRQGLISEALLSPYALLSNKMPLRNWTDNRFEHSFASGEVEGNRQATFVKMPAAAKSWTQPNQIVKAMTQYGPASPMVENAKVGDIYAFKTRYPFSDSWVIYGLIEVKSIIDDGGDTVSKTGNDEDYMEFDIKYFPGYRY